MATDIDGGVSAIMHARLAGRRAQRQNREGRMTPSGMRILDGRNVPGSKGVA